jgi:hypothetical protein
MTIDGLTEFTRSQRTTGRLDHLQMIPSAADGYLALPWLISHATSIPRQYEGVVTRYWWVGFS